MLAVLLGYLGLTAILVASVAGPLVAGRMLAEREEDELDPEVRAIEAEALARLAGQPQLAEPLARPSAHPHARRQLGPAQPVRVGES